MISVAWTSERKLLRNFLQAYKEMPCLWDQTHKYYSNREAKAQAYEVLVENYKQIDNLATIDTVKKKIDNMRSTYRREYKKVLASRERGENYQPGLWYYRYLTFLDEGEDEVEKTQSSDEDNGDYNSGDFKDTNITVSDGQFEEEVTYSPQIPVKKKLKTENVFIVEHQTEQPEAHNSSHYETNSNTDDAEMEAFGRTIGLQLKQVDDMQRHIAEKLMSDIIYYARLNQLNTRTTINLNENF